MFLIGFYIEVDYCLLIYVGLFFLYRCFLSYILWFLIIYKNVYSFIAYRRGGGGHNIKVAVNWVFSWFTAFCFLS